MSAPKYASNGESKEREDFLRSIPAPDDVFLAAARRAVVSAGVPDEILNRLHPEEPRLANRPPSR